MYTVGGAIKNRRKLDRWGNPGYQLKILMLNNKALLELDVNSSSYKNISVIRKK